MTYSVRFVNPKIRWAPRGIELEKDPVKHVDTCDVGAGCQRMMMDLTRISAVQFWASSYVTQVVITSGEQSALVELGDYRDPSGAVAMCREFYAELLTRMSEAVK